MLSEILKLVDTFVVIVATSVSGTLAITGSNVTVLLMIQMLSMLCFFF